MCCICLSLCLCVCVSVCLCVIVCISMCVCVSVCLTHTLGLSGTAEPGGPSAAVTVHPLASLGLQQAHVPRPVSHVPCSMSHFSCPVSVLLQFRTRRPAHMRVFRGSETPFSAGLARPGLSPGSLGQCALCWALLESQGPWILAMTRSFDSRSKPGVRQVVG